MKNKIESVKSKKDSLGALLRKLRRDQNLTLQQMSDSLGMAGPGSYRKYETDTVVPPADKLMQLAQLFGITVDYLLTREETISEERTVPGLERALAQAHFMEMLKHAGDDVAKLQKLNAALRAYREKNQ